MLHSNIKEANRRLVRVEPHFPDDSAILLEKSTIGREQQIVDFFETHFYLPYLLCILYGAGIYFGQKWMRNRPVFKVRPFLIGWNLFLATFSLMGSYRGITDTVVMLRKHGLTVSMCHPGGSVGVTGFWVTMFVLSKVFELVDTLFVVLRKQKLQTLHWYHHMSVLLYAFYSYPAQIAVARYFCIMNFGVHTIMYSYFALRAARAQMPHFVSVSITVLQISQMVVGMLASAYALYLYHSGTYCSITYGTGIFGFLLYASFLYGFSRLFLDKYLSADGGEDHSEGSAEVKRSHALAEEKQPKLTNSHVDKDDTREARETFYELLQTDSSSIRHRE